MKTQVELFKNTILELAPLFQSHWEELGIFRDRMPLVPQYDDYIRREANGGLLFVTARDEGKLVGYIIVHVMMGLHYATTPTALTDIVYIHPKVRNRGYALPLFKRAQKELKKSGIKYWISGFKQENNLGMSAFLSAFGFTPADVHYSKWIE